MTEVKAIPIINNNLGGISVQIPSSLPVCVEPENRLELREEHRRWDRQAIFAIIKRVEQLALAPPRKKTW